MKSTSIIILLSFVIISCAGNQVSRLYQKGFNYQENGENRKAIKYYNKVIELQPNHYDALNSIGIAFVRIDSLEKAINLFEKAISIKPNDMRAWNNKGLALNKLNRNDEAIELLDEAISINPNLHMSYFNKGKIFTELEKYEKAIECYERVVELQPNLFTTWLDLTTLNLKIDKKKTALKYIDKALEIKPSSLFALTTKQQILKNLKRWDELKECEEKIQSVHFELIPLYYDLSKSYAKKGKKQKMLEYLQKVIDLDKKYSLEAKNNPDFEAYRDDPDFIKLTTK